MLPMRLSAEKSAQDELHRVRRRSWDVSAVSGRQVSIDVEAIDVQRSGAQHTEIAGYRRVNEQIRGEGVPTLPTGVQISALAFDQTPRLLTPTCTDTVEVVRAAEIGQLVAEQKRLNPTIRGPDGGERTTFGFGAQEVVSASAVQHQVHREKRVNEQFRGELAGKKTAVDSTSQYLKVSSSIDAESTCANATTLGRLLVNNSVLCPIIAL